MLKHDTESCRKWLISEGWEILDVETLLAPFYHEIQDYPDKPDLAAKKHGSVFMFWYAHKGAFPWSERMNGPVTGIDYRKFKFALFYQTVTHYKSALIFKPEEGDFIFRQLDQLPTPRKWFTDGCSNPIKETELECVICFKGNLKRFSECKKRKRKVIAIWRIREFSNETAIQSTLF